MMKKTLPYIILILFILGFSCQDNDKSDVIIDEGNMKTVTLSLKLPGDMRKNASSTTKSMTEAQEQDVTTIDVLAFMNDGSGNYLYTYKSKGENISLNDGEGTFKVTLAEYYKSQVLVILANASDELSTVNIALNDNINSVLPLLTAGSDAEWDANNNNSGILRNIPMYCKTVPTIISNTTSTLGTFDLTRMLARLDIRAKDGITDFQLVNACIFNRKNRGYIAYKDYYWDGTKVTMADVPEDAITTKLNNILYSTDASHQITQSIYTFEAKGAESRGEATAIIVGGYYDYPANSSKVTYYRIDIPKTSSTDFSGDILRNHLYDIEIQSVADEGAETPENAFDGEIKITATVTPWNLAKQNVIFEGQYNLILNKASIDFKNHIEDQEIEISTTHPSGISISPITYIDENMTGWLEIAQLSANKWKISTNDDNYQAKRQAQITVTAGNMNYVVKVAQKGCGDNGTAELMEITQNSAYYTHLYDGKCWMVENSREEKLFSGNVPGYASDKYGEGGTIIGVVPGIENYQHYYTWEQATLADNACPQGWHLPTQAEFNALVSVIAAEPSTLGKFWFGHNYNYSMSGYYLNTNNEWHDWDIKGYWWCSSIDNNPYYYTGNANNMNGPVLTDENNWLSVRCVKD
ncbi:FISUMP domain-containing protein [Dysgonomonas gadei]|uniref:Uncharacterized protein n=1 Tax=Dysgonomonas gadei ATCC BAA-286 TaxID=742766 RepID=F5ITD4_9BACT|nr:FISUMP domain-containing protein [Dysgonomonas gadei]EGJ99318.1 hypothetical protein HMPREF9455_00351 [Dysgonomonas gadei ATCC BAA-286]